MKLKPRCLGLATLALASTFWTVPAGAQIVVWDGGGDGIDLGQAANWNPEGIPQNNNVLEWNGTVAGPLSLAYVTAQSSMNSNPGISINVTADQTASLLIDGGASALRLNGAGISIASGAGAFTLGDGVGTSNFTIAQGAMAMTHNSANPATIGSDAVFATTFAGNTTFNFSGSGDWNVNANLRSTNNAGGNIVNVTGSGTVFMNTLNTYTGGTNLSVNGGNARIRATADGALGSGGVFIAGNEGSNRLELAGGITLANNISTNGKGNSLGVEAAIMNVSGDNEISGTITFNVGGSYNTIRSDSGTLTLSGATAITHSAGGARGLLFTGDGNTRVTGNITQGGATMSIDKEGDGTLTLDGNNTYTGATTVSAGSLFLNGSLGNSAVSVGADATIGGTGSLAGDLSFDSTALLGVVDFSNPLAIAGTITFGSGFGIANLAGVDWDNLALNTAHTVISTSQVFSTSDIDNLGAVNAAAVGTGRFAYFENGGLAVVVIPEPSAVLLGGLGLLCLLRRRMS